MEILPPQKIKIIDIKGKGRGVVAIKPIKAGEIIEYSPIIFLSDKEIEFLGNESKFDILKFYYLYQAETDKHCIMLGYASLYNHSNNPNAKIDYDINESQNFVFFRALKDIIVDEEIVFDYEFVSGEEEFLKLD